MVLYIAKEQALKSIFAFRLSLVFKITHTAVC